MSAIIQGSEDDRFCPGCGGQLDDWGLCPNAFSRISLDLAGAWRLVSQPKKKLSPKEIRERMEAIAGQPITSEHAGEICLICRRQFYHGICPGCGLPMKSNSLMEIYLLFLLGSGPE